MERRRRAQLAGLVLVLASLPAAAQAPTPKREAWLELLHLAPKIVEAMRIPEGGAVAIYGLSTDAFLRPVIAAAGEGGAVHTVDRSRDRFEMFVRELQEDPVETLQPIFALDGDAHFRPGELDAVLIIDREGFFRSPATMYEHAAKALAPGGHLTVLRRKDKEISDKASRPAPGGHTSHADRLEANRNTVLATRMGLQLVEEDLQTLRHRNIRVFRRPDGGAEVSSGPAAPPGGSAPPARDPSASGGRAEP